MDGMPRGYRKLDWTAAAALLAERRDQPAVLLDGDGRVWLYNSALEQLLGRPRVEVLGRNWLEELVPADDRPATALRLKEAVAGAVRRCECPVLDASGERIILLLDLASVGGRGAPAVLASVVNVRRPATTVDHRGVVELHYDIATGAPDFGTITRASSAEKTLGKELVGKRCYEVIHKRHAPCAGCPALQANGSARRTAVISSGWNGAPFAIVSADPSNDGTRRMSSYFLGPGVVPALSRARLASLAEGAGLSQREQEVLGLLVLGRASKEIAHVLGISERTVKYHQSNILDKLGAESRVDLVRLFF